MINNNNRYLHFLAGDPARKHDAFATVGVTLDVKLGLITIKHAKQHWDQPYHIVAEHWTKLNDKIQFNFMVLETNKGKKAIKLFREKYDLPIHGIATSANLSQKSLSSGKAMDKTYTAQHLVKLHKAKKILFPQKLTADMQELINQWNEISFFKTPGGAETCKRIRGRHDDLFVALLLCVHLCRIYTTLQEQLK